MQLCDMHMMVKGNWLGGTRRPDPIGLAVVCHLRPIEGSAEQAGKRQISRGK